MLPKPFSTNNILASQHPIFYLQETSYSLTIIPSSYHPQEFLLWWAVFHRILREQSFCHLEKSKHTQRWQKGHFSHRHNYKINRHWQKQECIGILFCCIKLKGMELPVRIWRTGGNIQNSSRTSLLPSQESQAPPSSSQVLNSSPSIYPAHT